ncbi:MAG TPA: PilZ domain-containing protein [Pyrinomonadaceae bacterium]|nr:PilZ domain-containing protein [Pyrinomonadaceae bacterium]
MITNTPVTEKEARRIQRLALALPVRVEGKIDRSIGWNEITRLRDVSAFGAGFHLNRPVKRGRLIALTLPMPRQLRCYDHMEPQYKIWGLVRRCISVSTANSPEQYAIGLAFVGKNPPNGYLENPATLYEIIDQNNQGFWHIAEAPNNPDERDLPRELRRHSRYPIPINFLLETLDEEGNVTGAEMTVTENISLGGAAVFTSLIADVGSFLRVTSEQYKTTIISVVRGKRLGPDGIPRLHIEFIDHFFPLEGID